MPSLESIKAKLYTVNEYGVEHQIPGARVDEQDAAWLNKQFGLPTDRHPTCIACQARQMIKYAHTKDKKGNPNNRWQVPCDGIPNGLGPGSAAKLDQIVGQLNIDRDRAVKLLLASVDPVEWAELMFGFTDTKEEWRLRSYQKEQLRCSSRRITVREGRRAGKTFAMAVKLLYLAFNKRVPAGVNPETGQLQYTGPTIMVVTPYQSQILNIFDEMEKLIKSNKQLVARTTTGSGGSMYVKTPFFHMDFDNGAIVKGFVSGVGTKVDGSGGGTMRGQSAHVVYLDEMDMIPDDVLDKVVMPILLSDLKGDVTLVATSTPIGKRGRFYNWCLEDPTFKEDHLPSTVLPQWDRLKAMYENQGTHDTFRAEFMAEFIEGGHGVFRHDYVFRARRDYRYSDINRGFWAQNGVLDADRMRFTIGIDWNKNAGTEFCVVGYYPDKNEYWVVERKNIAAGQFSAASWKQEVIRLNHKWQPDYIYADEGYGHTIIEDLKLLAYEMRARASTPIEVSTSRLVDRLKSFNFSSKVELRNPVDGSDVSKSGKEFIVENTVRQFEDDNLRFSLYDEQLKRELLNYIILRFGATGKPVYGPESDTVGDHGLDSFMLALAAVQIEMGGYSAARPGSRPTYVSEQTLQERSGLNRDKHGIHALLASLRGGVPKFADVLNIEHLGAGVEIGAGGSVTSSIERKVKPRTRGSANQDLSVYEAFTSSASDARGYDTDTEHLYQKKTNPHVVSGRKSRSTRGQAFRRRSK
jgi:hypothetical protein